MGKIVESPDIQRIFDKPGRDWTPEERIRVKVWLHEDQQLGYLLRFALRHLGHEATPEDAEDAWGDFYAKRLDAVINNYDPAEGRRFWNWLLFCFERFCHRKGQEIRRQHSREAPLKKQTAGEEGERIELELVNEVPGVDPQAVLQEQRLAVRRSVWKCMSELTPSYHIVVVMHYFEEKSVAEIVEELDISESNVKVRLYRARQQLNECLLKEAAELLQEEGWYHENP
jgi:RNA polymerase sigma factor (sigma-70 family)